MIGWRILTLAAGLFALAMLPLGFLAVAFPYLPRFEESFKEASGHSPAFFFENPSIFSAVSFMVLVLPFLGMAGAAVMAWRALRRLEGAAQSRWMEGENRSADLARAWLTQITERTEVFAESEVVSGYRLLDELSTHHRRLLEPALRGTPTIKLNGSNPHDRRDLAIQIALWLAIAVMSVAALSVFLFAIMVASSNLFYQAHLIPSDLRWARATVGGLGLSWLSMVLVVGAAGLGQIALERSRWRANRKGLEGQQDRDLRQHAKACLSRLDTQPETSVTEVVEVLRAVVDGGRLDL